MKKILVTTDLSDNSKVAVRFAIQLATQAEYELTFLNVSTALVIDPYSEASFTDVPASNHAKQVQQLIKFIETLYRQTKKKSRNINFIVENKIDINEAILSCAKRIKADYICMSTRGEGLMNKLLGSSTSKVLQDSPIPVFVVPKYYRMKFLSSVLYPSDLENINTELPLIKKFANEFGANLKIYHYDYFAQEKEIIEKWNKIANKYKYDNIEFHLKELNPTKPLLIHLQTAILKMKPSIITMFVKKKKNWFEKLFQIATTSEKGFDTKTPMLVFRKL
ncbi:universal stress protein [Flavobacterium sp. KACC 22761]|uniref:universal stress protein n=1 Tax=Flavobacterium sp. KACC 22761 TaxID=3092665 RepID=UPI002A762B10|nr:universal stress protein [Flavobacterium sp. KACC 22761]WPO78542.1 universal stress protein [Flavobacterium sp. KACC 22761]